MVIIVLMSTNVLTIHVERMHHAQTHLVHTDAHVIEATKVKLLRNVLCKIKIIMVKHFELAILRSLCFSPEILMETYL